MKIQKLFKFVPDEYDVTSKKFIPCYDDFYGTITKMITSNISQPGSILDLGAGSGLLSRFWFQEFPNSEFVLLDRSEDALKTARKRFFEFNNVSYRTMDYTKDFPAELFDAVISSLCVNNIDNERKPILFKKIFEKLPEGGIFVDYDQFTSKSEKVSVMADKYWEKQISFRGLSAQDAFRWNGNRNLKNECSVHQMIEMLENAGFKEVDCIYSYEKFAVIIAIK
ncbi:class I SAM-dependent methyltransferase [Treponema zioleckii]|uniref:class I SAM-dependent methyltransferase n=1 Tax=Treponema zioleckii TaxID=331680 RepID=UPI00168BFB60|nr:class I SAM-dependent methyltransferase [Treponema zioleckii]